MDFVHIGDGKYMNKKYIICINKCSYNNMDYYEITYGPWQNPKICKLYDNDEGYNDITNMLKITNI